MLILVISLTENKSLHTQSHNQMSGVETKTHDIDIVLVSALLSQLVLKTTNALFTY